MELSKASDLAQKFELTLRKDNTGMRGITTSNGFKPCCNLPDDTLRQLVSSFVHFKTNATGNNAHIFNRGTLCRINVGKDLNCKEAFRAIFNVLRSKS